MKTITRVYVKEWNRAYLVKSPFTGNVIMVGDDSETYKLIKEKIQNNFVCMTNTELLQAKKDAETSPVEGYNTIVFFNNMM